MMMKKLISGLSAAAIAASCMAVGVSADEAPKEGGFYAAKGKWTINFDGSSMKNITTVIDPASDWKAPDDAKGQLIGYTDADTGKVTYNFGCNIQVGHMKKALVTVRVTSDSGNIWQADENNIGEGQAVSEGYMYTVQSSWNGDCAADFKSGWTHTYDADGNPVYANGACDLNGWNSGPGKFNGQWCQISLTDDDLSALHFELTIEATEKSAWEYHPYSADKEDEYQYVICNGFGGNGGFTPSSVSGDGDVYVNQGKTEAGAMAQIVVDGDYINKQIPGAECRPEKPVEPEYTSIKNAKITVKSKTAYTGKALKPAVTVTLSGKTLKKGTDYSVAYKNNKKPGKATVTVTGKGSYIDSKSKNFIIVPKKAAKPTVKAGKKQMTVTLKKDKLATGYQITYSLNKKFKSAKKVNIAKNSTVKKTIKKLKGGKVYYVKTRSYIKVGKTKYFGAYSAKKSVKVKK